jgi:Ni,Fe-hydrogenase I small subunit
MFFGSRPAWAVTGTRSLTAAAQPNIEDVLLEQIPWIPKVNLHNPFLALANGDDFLKPFHQAAEGKIENFILVVEGSIPNEHNKGRRLLGFPGYGPEDRSADHYL